MDATPKRQSLLEKRLTDLKNRFSSFDKTYKECQKQGFSHAMYYVMMSTFGGFSNTALERGITAIHPLSTAPCFHPRRTPRGTHPSRKASAGKN